MDWKLKFEKNGSAAITKTFAEWGLGPPALTFVNQGRDGCSFAAPGRATDAADLFDLGTGGIGHRVTVLRDATKIFTGIITETPRQGDQRKESNRFTAAGPWWLLEELTYEQTWKYWNGSALATAYNSHLFLGQAPDGTYITNAQVVADVIAFAAPVILASCGMTITADLTGFDGIAFPVAEVRDISCAEAIKKVLRYTPDAKLWWDYTGANPVLRVARRSALASVALPLSAGNLLQSVDITPRLDLLRPVVILNYEISSTVNGTSYTGKVVDKWPANGPDRAVRAYKSTINLQGASTIQAYVETRPIEPLTEDWWKVREAWLADPDVTQFTPPPSVTRQSSLPRELVQGQLADWMRHSNGNLIASEKDTVVGTGNVSNSSGTQDKVFSTNIIATDAITGLYSVVQQYGEPVPVGLAQHFYEAVNTLHWQGSFTICEAEFTGLVGLANVLNLTGGLADWETMDAFVWNVSVDAGAGKTTITFGPSENLGPADLADLARASRNRLVLTAPSARVTGQGAGGMALGRTVANMQASSGPSAYSEFAVTQPGQPGNATVRATEALGKDVRLRVVPEYDGNCVLRSRVIFCSELY
jgi:hypothetical protein